MKIKWFILIQIQKVKNWILKKRIEVAVWQLKKMMVFFFLLLATIATAQKIRPVEPPVSQPEEKIATVSPADTGVCNIKKAYIANYADGVRMVWVSFPDNLLGEEIIWRSEVGNAILTHPEKHRIGPASLSRELPKLPEGTTVIDFFFVFLGQQNCPTQKITVTVKK